MGGGRRRVKEIKKWQNRQKKFQNFCFQMFKWNYDYSWIFPKSSEQIRRLVISLQLGQLRIDAKRKCFSKSVSNSRPQKLTFCISSVFGLESWSVQHSKSYTVSTMELERLLCFPIILSKSSCVQQDITRTSVFSDLNNATLANPALVSQGFEYASTQTNVQKKLLKTISRLIRGIPPLSTEQNAYSCGLEDFSRLRRAGSLRNYELA